MKLYLGVGINYTNDSGITPLQKCVDDVVFAADYFSSIGYTCLQLTNAAATKANIYAAIRTNIATCNASGEPSVFVYHHSSHGMQVRDKSNDERDGMDEAVCTYDTYWSEKDGDFVHAFTDDEYHELFMEMNSESLVLGVFDCCHTGGIARKIVPNRRYVWRRDGTDRPATKKECRDGYVQTSYPYVILAGAASDGYSYEDQYGGLLTRAFVKTLMNHDKPMARRCMIKHIIRDVHSKGFQDQTPHYECMKTRMRQRELTPCANY